MWVAQKDCAVQGESLSSIPLAEPPEKSHRACRAGPEKETEKSTGWPVRAVTAREASETACRGSAVEVASATRGPRLSPLGLKAETWYS